MAVKNTASYLNRLLSELGEIHSSYGEILAVSAIISTDLPSNFIGFPLRKWVKSDGTLELARMDLLRRIRDWNPRFRLLFPHPTPTVSKRLDEHIGRLERWLVRDSREHLPSTLAEIVAAIEADVTDLRALAELLPSDEYATRLVVDTNTLIDNPDVAVHIATLGKKFMVHVLPVVLREIDEQKRSGRIPEVREAAKRAERRLKSLRDNGDVRTGVRVAGDVYAVFEYIEPKADHLPSWLDLTVPDDRFVASSLLVQSTHAGSALYVATSDINLQTKLAAVGLPFVEVPKAP